MIFSQRILLLAVTLVCAATLDAGGTRQRQVKSAEDFEQGEARGAAIQSSGSLVLGRAASWIEGLGRAVWSIAPAEGGGFYLATLDPAAIHLLRDGRVTELYADPKALGFTLAPAPGGGVFAAELGRAAVWRVTPDGKAVVHGQVGAAAIWALTAAPDGALIAATGPRGALYRVASPGDIRELFDSDENNLMSVAIGPDGELLAGGGEKGNLYRVYPDGKGRVLYHFTGDGEIRAIVSAGATLYAAVNSREEPRAGEPDSRRSRARSGSGEHGPRADGPRRVRVGANLDDDEPVAPDIPAADGGLPLPGGDGTDNADEGLSGALYSVDGERRSELLASFPGEFILCLAREEDGALLVGTGPHGRLYRVVPGSGDRQTLHQSSQAHVLSLGLVAGRLSVAGLGEGGAVLLSGQRTVVGTWTSAVFDGGSPLRYGALRVHGTGSVTVATRSGDSPRPDATWSPWSRELPLPGGAVASPPGRYLQLRAQLTNGATAPSVDDIEFFHAAPNHKPRIESFGLDEDEPPVEAVRKDSIDLKDELDKLAQLTGDTGRPEGPGADSRGTKAGEKGPAPERHKHDSVLPHERRVRWSAVDSDDDTLVYRLHHRDETLGPDAPWLPVFRGDPIEETEYLWDTTTVPDGRYVLRLSASDEKSNAASATLTGVRLTGPLTIDNTRPEIERLAVTGRTVSGIARDRGGHVASLSISIDGGPFSPAPVTDGIFDSAEEPFSFPLDTCPPGPHVLAVEAADGAGNLGLAHVLFRVER